MVDEPKPIPAVSNVGDVGRAPVIFFDAVPALGGFNGLVAIALSAALQSPQDDGKVKVEQHVVAHLRTNVEGIRALKAAIDGALLAMEPTQPAFHARQHGPVFLAQRRDGGVAHLVRRPPALDVVGRRARHPHI